MTKQMKTGQMKMKTTTGNNLSLAELFGKQVEFQKLIVAEENLPTDNIDWFKYHCLAMIEEMGEVMKADKRWKTHRNTRYDKAEKLDELSDVFITFMNLCLFSGFSATDMEDAIGIKINENFERIKREC